MIIIITSFINGEYPLGIENRWRRSYFSSRIVLQVYCSEYQPTVNFGASQMGFQPSRLWLIKNLTCLIDFLKNFYSGMFLTFHPKRFSRQWELNTPSQWDAFFSFRQVWKLLEIFWIRFLLERLLGVWYLIKKSFAVESLVKISEVSDCNLISLEDSNPRLV